MLQTTATKKKKVIQTLLWYLRFDIVFLFDVRTG